MAAARPRGKATTEQLREWMDDPLLDELRAAHRRGNAANPIDDAWITLGYHAQPAEVAV